MRLLRITLIGLLCLVLLLVAVVILAPLFVPGLKITSLAMVAHAIFGTGSDLPPESDIRERLQLPPGYHFNVYARGLGNVRFMSIGESGELMVSRPRQGDVLLFQADANGDGLPDGQEVLIDGLRRPHGIALQDGWLYIAESHQVGRIRYSSIDGRVDGDYQIVVPDLPDGGNHWTKSIGFDAAGDLYLSIGSTCNVCEEDDPRRASIMRFDSVNWKGEIHADGLRNSVGFDWAPWNQALYATDNGRDLLGDDFPPCELNRVEAGQFYGWPYLNGDNQIDPDLGDRAPARANSAIKPVFHFRAHNAPLGIRFLRYSRDPSVSRSALVALHGSWNRSEADGYKVVRLDWSSASDQPVSTDFFSGFLDNGNVIGRPVDIVENRDGTLYVSDDYSGSIYRISYGDQVRGSDALAQQKAQNRKTIPDVDTAHLSKLGAELYEQNQCQACHYFKTDERGQQGVRKHLTGLAQKYSKETLADFFTAPTPPMPRFELSTEERAALAYYLLQTAP